MRIMLVSIMTVVIASSCASQPTTRVNDYVTPSDLNTRPDFFDGKTVVIHGFILIGDEQRFMVDDRYTYENWTGDDTKCLTTANDNHLWAMRLKLSQKMVELRGVFRKRLLQPSVVTLGTCSISAIELDPTFKPRLLSSP